MTQLLEAEVSNGEPNYIVELLGCVSSDGWQRGDHLGGKLLCLSGAALTNLDTCSFYKKLYTKLN